MIFISKDYNMGRPKLKTEDKKIKVSITLDRAINDALEQLTNNKSKLITELLIKHINNEK